MFDEPVIVAALDQSTETLIVIVVLFLAAVFVAVLLLSLHIGDRKQKRARRRILERLQVDGVAVAGTITRLKNLSVYRPHYPTDMEIHLQVELPTGELVETVARERAPTGQSVRVGQRLWVYIIPDEPTIAGIQDFESAPPPSTNSAPSTSNDAFSADLLQDVEPPVASIEGRLRRLDELLERGAISAEEHQKERQRVLSQL